MTYHLKENASETSVCEKDTFQQNKKSLILAAGFVSFLEMFDFTVYGFFSVIIAKNFFSAKDPLTGLLIAVSVFGLGFFMRPLGSILVGAYADRQGRKNAMLLTIVLMALGGACIALAPPYKTAGLLAPVVIVLGRLIQGFAAGGENGAASSLLVESGLRDKRGSLLRWQFVGQGLSSLFGSLFAAALTHYLTPEQLNAWGWRLPFLFALLILPLGLYVRAHVKDTLDPNAPLEEVQEAQLSAGLAPRHKDVHPFKELITQYPLKAFLATLTILPTTGLIYVMVFFMPHYLTQVTHLQTSDTFLLSAYASVIMSVFAGISGYMADRIERRKPFILLSLILGAFLSYMTFHFVHNTRLFLVFYSLVIVNVGIMMTTTALFVIESFPKYIRATASGATYAFGVAIFGGTSHIIVAELLRLSHANIMAPFWYLGTAAFIGVLCFAAYPEKRYDI